ncbi:MAG TPA: hypothetical protein VGQ65_06165 [Thermoanaerobaculia bacterium]|nr:hypothetical protein [Thermoanaerobaculia bacterium]
MARHSTPVLNESTQNATSDIDVAYSQLEAFIRNFSAIDDRWSDAYIKQLNAWVTALLNGEKKYWEVIRANYTRADEGSPEYEHWASVSAILGRRRTAAVLPLVRLKANTQVRIGKMRTTHSGTTPVPVLEKNIESITSFRVSAALEQTALDFVRADALQEEELFAEMMSRRDELITGITSPSAFGEFRELLLNRLWTMSDLIIIDELRDLRAGLFAALTRDRSVRPRYAALMLTLRSSEPPTEECVRSIFEKVGLSFTVQDLHAVWRSIVVGMSNRKKRVAALSHIPVEVLWRTIVSTNIRVSVLWTVAERFRRESDDANKIFFDCVHARLVREVEVGGDELASVGRLISHFFQLPLFVQSPYFERLDDLLLNYKRVSSDMKLPADIFNNLAVKLRQVREDLGNPQASMPAGIEELPLPVQRHLASKGRYINSFVMHPNFRIASEIFPFITIANVESLITYRQFNEMLFQKVLQKKEFFTRQSTVVVALQHPKCTVEFARLNLLKIGEANLKKVAANVSANSAVREMAKRILASRPRNATGTTG